MRSFLLSLFFVLTCCPALRLGAAELPVLKIYFEGEVSMDMDYVDGTMRLSFADEPVVELPAKFRTRGAT
ncbi:MAG: hypothetical protein IKM71_00290, partial [Bacteroidaceae bacterium]|nr:hypothetical protein [Bacteroidaceae bacterium]